MGKTADQHVAQESAQLLAKKKNYKKKQKTKKKH